MQFWQTVFLRQGLFVKHESESRCWLCMGTLPEKLCCILWPAEKVTTGKHVLWIPKTSVQGKQDLRVRSVFSVGSWQVIPTKVWSAVHCFVQKVKDAAPVSHVQTGKPVSLLQHAAENAFWDIPTRYLKRLRKAGHLFI